jgi:hypothetical protein
MDRPTVRLAALAAALFALAAVPDGATAAPPVVVGSRVTCIEDRSADAATHQSEEAACLAATAGEVVRRDEKLVVHTASGGEVVFDSNAAACDSDEAEACHVVWLHSYDATLGFAVVEEGFYEQATASLIDLKTGDKVEIFSAPAFSPSGALAVSVIADLMNEPDFELLVYDLSASPFRRVHASPRGSAGKFLRKNKDEATFRFDGWDGETRVRLLATDGADGGSKPNEAAVVLEQTKGKWTLKAAKRK